jgi:hypothetical protein
LRRERDSEAWPGYAGDAELVATMTMRNRAFILGAIACVACGAPEQENVTITGTEVTTNVTITGTGADGDGSGADETAEGGEPGFAGDPFTFHIEETTQFMSVPGVDGCDNDDLNSVGGALWAAMLADGWTGEYLQNEEGTPYNFVDPMAVEGSLFGQEGTTSDSRRVTVIASHGNVNLLQWGQPGATPVGALADCRIRRIHREMQLGSARSSATYRVLPSTLRAARPTRSIIACATRLG